MGGPRGSEIPKALRSQRRTDAPPSGTAPTPGASARTHGDGHCAAHRFPGGKTLASSRKRPEITRLRRLPRPEGGFFVHPSPSSALETGRSRPLLQSPERSPPHRAGAHHFQTRRGDVRGAAPGSPIPARPPVLWPPVRPRDRAGGCAPEPSRPPASRSPGYSRVRVFSGRARTAPAPALAPAEEATECGESPLGPPEGTSGRPAESPSCSAGSLKMLLGAADAAARFNYYVRQPLPPIKRHRDDRLRSEVRMFHRSHPASAPAVPRRERLCRDRPGQRFECQP